MSLPDSATLTINVRGRRSERWLGALALLAPILATHLLPLPTVTAAEISILAASIVAAGLWWHGWLGGVRRLTHVSRSSDGRWLLEQGAQAAPATLSEHSRVGSHWLWLGWHSAAGRPKRRFMLILQGDVLPAELRRLAVRLRLDAGL
ncbi:hypothetical protein [Steroidobacter sp.]|uniref:hypothetical protein n=1 Tax=Steroidobacter sp. TaxID=1978227 RepID=UPI001A54EE60|nr:hypothetical protein [Steroidobacter sp.]MBL8264875.1 hypothetical protein [Steroidobacter sp.]